VHAGPGAPPCQDDAVELGGAGHAVRSAPDERREELVSVVEFVDRFEQSDGVQGWVHAGLSSKKLAEVLVVEVAAPVAFHQSGRDEPLREGQFNGPIVIVAATRHGGGELEQQRHRDEAGNADASTNDSHGGSFG